jgi:mRNA interferase MazF
VDLVKMEVNRFDIWLVGLDPSKGSEIAKSRPCLIISPNSANKYLKTVIVAPLTHSKKGYPTRVNCVFENQEDQIVLDQIRAIDKNERLIKKLGTLDLLTSKIVSAQLEELFRF